MVHKRRLVTSERSFLKQFGIQRLAISIPISIQFQATPDKYYQPKEDSKNTAHNLNQNQTLCIMTIKENLDSH